MNPESSQQVFVTGRLAERGGKFYAVYEEPPSTGLEGTRTTIKWDRDRVLLLRSGAVEHRQEFKAGLVDIGVYKTQGLCLPVSSRTSSVSVVAEASVWRICIEYSMEISGDSPCEITLKILIEEENKGGYKENTGTGN